jgi:hypothetical protein
MTPDGGKSHGRSHIEDHPVTVGLSMSWVCLDSIDVKVLSEIESVVLAEVSQWMTIHIKHNVRYWRLDGDDGMQDCQKSSSDFTRRQCFGGLDKKL